jgi:hypothetical protein
MLASRLMGYSAKLMQKLKIVLVQLLVEQFLEKVLLPP